MYDNTRDCAKCGLLAAGGSADIPHPTPPVWVRLYAAAGNFAEKLAKFSQIWAETRVHKQHCCRHTEQTVE